METNAPTTHQRNNMEDSMRFTTTAKMHLPCDDLRNPPYEAHLVDENGNRCGLVTNPTGTTKLFRSREAAENFDTAKLTTRNRSTAEYLSAKS
jgi:hypothetical protein